MHRDKATTERDLRVGAVDPGHPCVADERRVATGCELAEATERAGLDVDRRCREDDLIDVVRDLVRRLGIHGRALREERAELELVLRERAALVANPVPGLTGVDLDMDRERALAKRAAHLRGTERAAAEREHRGRRRVQPLDGHLGLLRSEERLAFHLEQLPDRAPGEALELPVDVDERPGEPFRDLPAERRLACAHKTHERDVLVQRACHGIRSR